jgi:transcriptional regulator GlxA family with amidase domain
MTRRVVAVVFDGFLLLDLAGPLGAFEVAGAYVEDGYAVELVSVSGGPVRSSGGVTVETTAFEVGEPVDLMIVPGGAGSIAAALDRSLLALVRRLDALARRSASVCSGAFVLAAAGILDGRRATTHWEAASKLRRDHPNLKVDSDSLFIQDGAVWTSAGITAGIDMALALIERDLGFATAQKVAQGLVVAHRRAGGQRQFSAALDLQGPDGRFGPLLEWVRARTHERLDVERLACFCALSPRHFSRAFTAATGMAPPKAIEQLRVDQARSDVLAGQEALEVIARRHGFGGAARMRRSFIRVLGQTPQALRTRGQDARAAAG